MSIIASGSLLQFIGKALMFLGANVIILQNVLMRKPATQKERGYLVMAVGLWIGSAASLLSFVHVLPHGLLLLAWITGIGVIITAIGFVILRLPQKFPPTDPEDNGPMHDPKTWPPAPRA